MDLQEIMQQRCVEMEVILKYYTLQHHSSGSFTIPTLRCTAHLSLFFIAASTPVFPTLPPPPEPYFLRSCSVSSSFLLRFWVPLFEEDTEQMRLRCD